MDYRDELQDLIDDNAKRSDFPNVGVANPEELAALIRAAGYVMHRTITTLEELDALPGESVVRDLFGMVFEKDLLISEPTNEWWIETGSSLKQAAKNIDLPATVLYEPEVTG